MQTQATISSDRKPNKQMPNLLDHWLFRRSRSKPPLADAATLLRQLVAHCTACSQLLDHHTYRYIASHPSAPSPSTTAFITAIHQQDWLTVRAIQQPALEQPLFVLYALACPPSPQATGMLALLHLQNDPLLPDHLFVQQPLNASDFAALRASCATCQWLPLGPPLQSGQETV